MTDAARGIWKSVLLAASIVAVIGTGCGSGNDEAADADRSTAAEPFPKVGGRTTEQIYEAYGGDDQFVVSPTGQVFRPGENRFGFGVFDLGHEQITDAEVAIYVGRPNRPATGPYEARAESLATESEFAAETTAADPDSAKAVYVSEVKLGQPGEWRVIAVVRDGDELEAVRTPSIEVGAYGEIPEPGERAPNVHTPTGQTEGELDRIDTRAPHDSMHDVDFADALGRRPAVIVFATPLLCMSRVCGPVVDIAEQVKSEHGDQVAFIHMEIFEDNDANKGPRPQFSAFGLQTEPWLFVVDREGRVTEAIEGAFSARELEQAVRKVR